MAMSKHDSEIEVDPVSHPQENFPCTRLASVVPLLLPPQMKFSHVFCLSATGGDRLHAS